MILINVLVASVVSIPKSAPCSISSCILSSMILLALMAADSILNQYRGYANCVLFMGGEWHPEELTHKLALARDLGFETCLYTGREQVEPEIMSELTWVKTGPWIESLGGLTSPTTNQRFVEVKTNKLYNNHFLTKNM